MPQRNAMTPQSLYLFFCSSSNFPAFEPFGPPPRMNMGNTYMRWSREGEYELMSMPHFCDATLVTGGVTDRS